MSTRLSRTLVTLAVLSLCLNLIVCRPPTPNSYSGYSLVWCYWAGQAALSSDNCLHGNMMGPCGPVCLKGPGETCGGAQDRYGVCGPGMFCQDHMCHGCSALSQECSDTLA